MAGEAASGTSSACNSFPAQPSDQKTILPRSSTLSRGSLHPPRPNLKTPHPSSPHRYFFDSSQAPAHPRTEQGWGCSLLRGRKKQIQILKKSQIISSRIKTRPRGANGVAHPSMPGFPLNYLLFWCKQSGYRSYHGAGDPSCLLSGFIRAFFFFSCLLIPGLIRGSLLSPATHLPGQPCQGSHFIPLSLFPAQLGSRERREMLRGVFLTANHFIEIISLRKMKRFPPKKALLAPTAVGPTGEEGKKHQKVSLNHQI